MNEHPNKALLPNGLRDVLPPDADAESDVVAEILAVFRSSGYDRVEPPLVEFEESLVDGPGKAVSPQTFRLMDPVSQRMMGVRADITPQVARIAASRLARSPRPLRLSYAGQVLRVRGSELQPDRQVGQVGVELIGSDSAEADIEVIALVGEALERIGVRGASVDLSLPPLVPAVCAAFGLDRASTDRARLALDRKDAAALRALDGDVAATLRQLLEATGPAEDAVAILSGVAPDPDVRKMCSDFVDVIVRLQSATPALTLTVDPVEFRGMEYQSGLSFTVFAATARAELGRGGRYALGNGEPATGFTFYLEALLQAVPGASPPPRVFVPCGTDRDVRQRLHGDGWRTISGLLHASDVRAEARRLGCTHLLEGGSVHPLD
jgi:ATP phosphoribosyltransferase regulatory subunit